MKEVPMVHQNHSKTFRIGAACCLIAAVGIAASAVLMFGNESQAQPRRERMARTPRITYAVAEVHPLGDHKVSGKVTFTQTDEGIEVVADLTGLQPGEHGFHIHEFGDCSMADGKCAGAHFNPTNQPHGGPDDAHRHVGDLGNIKADGQGHGTYKRVDKVIALNGPRSIIGRAVIVHAEKDDFKSVASAGARIGCGVIGIADPKMAQH
ncbi:MAG TPA: superoxide dismutase family protein [Lacipirellulaceae bacterium]|nr:superoxide dismutase family protein [Lacipirellulaceae bacterium]